MPAQAARIVSRQQSANKSFAAETLREKFFKISSVTTFL